MQRVMQLIQLILSSRKKWVALMRNIPETRESSRRSTHCKTLDFFKSDLDAFSNINKGSILTVPLCDRRFVAWERLELVQRGALPAIHRTQQNGNDACFSCFVPLYGSLHPDAGTAVCC